MYNLSTVLLTLDGKQLHLKFDQFQNHKSAFYCQKCYTAKDILLKQSWNLTQNNKNSIILIRTT